MTNWCDCTLEISGEPEDVRDFLAAMTSPESGPDDERRLVVDQAIPLPPESRTTSATPSEALDDSEQIIESWGRKLQAYDTTVECQPGGGSAKAHFETEYSPPMSAITYLADQFPDLTFELAYCELNAGFAGRARRAPGCDWARIHASSDLGYMAAAFDAQSRDGYQDPDR